MLDKGFNRLLYALLILVSMSSANASNSSEKSSIDAKQLQREAQRLTAEALSLVDQADQDRRKQLLELALKKSPNHSKARWALGQIEREGSWQSVSEIQKDSAKDPRQKEYDQRKQELSNTAQGHEKIAKWCTKQGLEDEARAHWIGLLQHAPNHRVALANLDLEWHNGILVESSFVRANDEGDRETVRQKKTWAKLVARWARSRGAVDLERDAILEKIRRIDDPTAIPAFEELAETLGKNLPKRDRACQLCEAFVVALDSMPEASATESLVRFSVFTEEEILRHQAAEALVGRPLEISMPMLLSGLQPLTKSEFNIAVDEEGSVGYQHEVHTMGRDLDHTLHRTHVGRHQFIDIIDPTLTRRGRTVSDQMNDALIARFQTQIRLLEYQEKAAELEAQIVRSNLSSRVINDRILPVLRLVTSQQLGDNPQAWWDYWNEYRGYEVNRGSERDYEYDEDASKSVRIVPPSCECFVAGTPVITKRGDKAIEAIQPGDFVLSRNPSTGELSFQVVLEVTVRQPSPMVKIEIGDETIVSTVGHPFWVEKLGWRMAKQLNEGDRLSALDKSTYVNHVEPVEDAVAYNLVVEGTATYLVGKQGILVHDNTPAEANQRKLAMR